MFHPDDIFIQVDRKYCKRPTLLKFGQQTNLNSFNDGHIAENSRRATNSSSVTSRLYTWTASSFIAILVVRTRPEDVFIAAGERSTD